MPSLFDGLFGLFSTENKSAPPTQTKGAPGTAVFGGYIVTDEKNSKLIGTEKYITFSNMLANISIVSAGTRYFLNLVAKAEWKVKEADDSAEALRFAQIIADNMGTMETSWSRIIRRAAMYRFYGFSIQEWTAEKNELGDLIFKDIAPRPQKTIERWDVERTGKVIGMGQLDPQTGHEIYLPRDKTIYVVDDALNDSPEGLGLFRHIVESSKRLQRYEQLEGFGFESDLRGIPIGRAPFAKLQAEVSNGTITASDKKLAEAGITEFIGNHIKNPALGILLDSLPYESQDEAGTPSTIRQWDIDLLKGSSTSLPEMAKAIERVNREIARTLGVEGLLLGEQTAGSHALSKDKSLNFALIVDSTLSELADTFKRDFIGRIFELNGWPKDKMPTFKPEAIQHRDITQVTQALKDMAKAGAPIPLNDPVINEVRNQLGLSDQEEQDEIEDTGEKDLSVSDDSSDSENN